MCARNWSAPTSSEEVAKRAGGRRHYNHWRQTVALIRQMKVSQLIDAYYSDLRFRRDKLSIVQWGAVKAIAEHLGVHPSTICRDIKVIMSRSQRCPHCGQFPKLEKGSDAAEVLDACERDAQQGNWQWAGRRLPRTHLDRAAVESCGPTGSAREPA